MHVKVSHPGFGGVVALLLAVLAFNSGDVSAAANDWRSVISGNWSNPTTWEFDNGGGFAPAADFPGNAGPTANVLIQTTHGVVLDVSPANTIGSLTISGSTSMLTIGNSVVGRTLDVVGDVTVGTSIVVDAVNAAAHNLKIGGNLTNNGTFDMMAVAGTHVCNVELKAAGAQTISGTPSLTRFNAVTVFAGASVVQNIAVVIEAQLTIQPTASYDNTGQDFEAKGPIAVDGMLIHSSPAGTPKKFTGPVAVSNTGVWNNSGNSDIIFRAGIDTTATAAFASGTGTQYFEGNQVLTGAGVILFNGNVEVGDFFTVTNAKNTTITGNLQGGAPMFGEGEPEATGGMWVNAPGSSLNLQGAILSPLILVANAMPNVVNYIGGAQTIEPVVYHDLLLSGAGTKTMSTSITAIGSLTIAPGVTLATGSGNTITLGGTLSNLGTVSGTNTTWVFGGPGPQAIIGSTVFDAMVVNNAMGVSLLADQTVVGALTLSNGKITTGANRLFIAPTGTIVNASATRYIAGNLSKTFAVGSGQSFTYPIGDLTNYTPLDVNNLNVTVGGSLQASSMGIDVPSIATSGLNAARSANRHFKLSASAITATFNATFNFLAGDLDAGADPLKFELKRFDGAAWSAVTVGTRTATSIQGTGISSAALGEFQAAELPSPNPPTITSISVTATQAKTGVALAFSAVATPGGTSPLTFTWDFKDGTAPSVGNPVNHTFTIGGDFPVVLTVSDGSQSKTATLTVSIFKPASGGEGVTSVSLGKPPVSNPLNGVSIKVSASDGGVIELEIDINALIREAFSVSTDFDGINGRQSTSVGTKPVFKAATSGLIVATSTVTEITSSQVRGKARKTIPISKRETGESREVTTPPANRDITLNSMKGKFLFNKATPDAVSFTGSVELPAGLDVSLPQEFSIGMGNVIDRLNVDTKGKMTGSSELGRIKKLKIKYPRLPKGQTLTEAGQQAQIQLTMSTADMDLIGFDTEGITASLRTDEEGQKSVNRSIQVAMILGGVGYEGLAPVQYKLSAKKDAGQMISRSGQ